VNSESRRNNEHLFLFVLVTATRREVYFIINTHTHTHTELERKKISTHNKNTSLLQQFSSILLYTHIAMSDEDCNSMGPVMVCSQKIQIFKIFLLIFFSIGCNTRNSATMASHFVI
jgi:hypothetical protein